MFIGSFKYNLDNKSRVAIPAKLRKYIKPDAKETFVITRGTAKCIDLYPMDIWEEMVNQRLNRLNSFDPKDAQFMRLFLREATDDTLDSQARITLPKNLIEYAGISKEVMVVGVMTKIEIWDPETYEQHMNDNDEPYVDIAKEVMKMPIQ